jgi:hypothetical protein
VLLTFELALWPTGMGSQTRRRKHKEAVAQILAEVDRLPKGKALRIGSLGENQKGVRAALYRAAQLSGRSVSTVEDAEFLYVWNGATGAEG